MRDTPAARSQPMPAPHACTPCLHPMPRPYPTDMPPTHSSYRYAPSCSPAASRDLDGPVWTLGTSIAHHCQHTTASTPLPAHHCQHITASTSLPLPAHHCHCECITALPAHHCKHTTDTTDTHHSQQQESVIKKRHQEAPSRSAAIKKRHHAIKKRHQEAPSRHQEAPPSRKRHQEAPSWLHARARLHRGTVEVRDAHPHWLLAAWDGMLRGHGHLDGTHWGPWG